MYISIENIQNNVRIFVILSVIKGKKFWCIFVIEKGIIFANHFYWVYALCYQKFIDKIGFIIRSDVIYSKSTYKNGGSSTPLYKFVSNVPHRLNWANAMYIH